MRNVLFDICVYHQPGVDLLPDVVGAVRGIDPRTRHHVDDTRHYVDASALGAVGKADHYEGNVRRIYPRLDTIPARAPA